MLFRMRCDSEAEVGKVHKSQSIDTPGEVLIQYKWKLFIQIFYLS